MLGLPNLYAAAACVESELHLPSDYQTEGIGKWVDRDCCARNAKEQEMRARWVTAAWQLAQHCSPPHPLARPQCHSPAADVTGPSNVLEQLPCSVLSTALLPENTARTEHLGMLY